MRAILVLLIFVFCNSQIEKPKMEWHVVTIKEHWYIITEGGGIVHDEECINSVHYLTDEERD